MKLAFVRLMAAFAICLIASSSSIAGIHEGLTAYWPMDGDVLDFAGGIGGASTVDDNGSIVGDAGSFSFGPGKFGDAGILDGNTGYVSVPTSVDLERTAQDLSISAWFRVDAFDTGWQTLISKGEQSAYRIARQGGDTNSIAYAGGSEDLRDSADVNDQAWRHVVAITDNTNSVASYYLDGVLVQDSNDPARGPYTSGIAENDPPLDLFIGANPETSPPRQWEGGIDDVAIWNRAITVDEIAALYNGGIGASVLSLAAPSNASVAWDDVVMGTTVADLIGGPSIAFVTGVYDGGNADGNFFTGGGGDTGNADLNTIYDSHGWNGVGATITIDGLNAGNDYQIQLLSAGDTRGCCDTRNQAADDGNGNVSGDMERGNNSVVGRFTASGSTQDISIISGTVNGVDPGLSGYILTDGDGNYIEAVSYGFTVAGDPTATVIVPEPSSAALLILAGMAGMARLRRRRRRAFPGGSSVGSNA